MQTSRRTSCDPIAQARQRVEAAYREHDEQTRQWLKGEIEIRPEPLDWPPDSQEAHAALMLDLEEEIAECEIHPRIAPEAVQGLRHMRNEIRGHAVLLRATSARLRQPVRTSRARECRPRARQRAGASSRSSGTDPGDSSADSDEPHAAPLRLAPRRAVFTYGCLSAAERGADVERVIA